MAAEYFRDELAPVVANDLKAWAWLPSVEQIEQQIGQMFANELLAMKARAEGQRASEPGRAEATCHEYWETGKQPAGLRKDCTAEMRLLAKDFRRRVLVPRANASLKAFEWIPSEDLIDKMSISELLALKTLAEGK